MAFGLVMLAKFYLSVKIIQSFLGHILLVSQLGQSGVESVKLSLKQKWSLWRLEEKMIDINLQTVGL